MQEDLKISILTVSIVMGHRRNSMTQEKWYRGQIMIVK